MDIDIRPIVQDEFPAYLRATARAFGGHALDEYIERYAKVFIPGRWIGAFQGSDLVGGASSVPSSIGVEGAALPVAAVEDVTVLPTHTRRGIMTRMIDHQFRDLFERGEPIAALWASESIIYGRFGYGVGSFHEQWKISRPHAAFLRPVASPGAVEFVTPREAAALFPDVFRRAIQGRPASIDRPQVMWEAVLADPERDREGASAFFHVVYRNGGVAEGYASYRMLKGVLSIWETMSNEYTPPTPRSGSTCSGWTSSTRSRRTRGRLTTLCHGCSPTRAGSKGGLLRRCGSVSSTRPMPWRAVATCATAVWSWRWRTSSARGTMGGTSWTAAQMARG